MKTLLISENFPPRHGGSGRWLWEIYRRFPREAVVILAGDHPDARGFDDTHDLTVERAPLMKHHWGVSSLESLREYHRLKVSAARLVERFSCDRIHCARLLPEGWVGWMLKMSRGIPYVCYVHGEELHYGVASRELRWMMRRVLTGAELLIANSDNTRRLLTGNWRQAASRIAVLHPGVDTSRFVPADISRSARQRLDWVGRSVILTVGRLQKRKGQDMLIRALPRIREEVPNVLYSVLGGGDQLGELHRLVQELELQHHVQFLGEPTDDDLIACYQQCDLFVLPNREIDGDIEGFGMVLVEAQACGKAVVAGDSGGTRETMQVGRTGVIVDCTRPEPLAEIIVELLLDNERRGTMGAAGRRWIQQSLDWTSLAAEAHAVLIGKPADAVTV